MTPILPPYAQQLDRTRWRASLWVITGSGAWQKARSQTWFPGQKIILPFGDDIGRYRWPVAGRECIVASEGEPESRPRLVNLSVALVKAGAVSVIWCGLEFPAPIFRPSALPIAS
jgi:hypothetical protein